MNPKFITWFETLLHVVLEAVTEQIMLICPQPQPIRVKQPMVAILPDRTRHRLPISQVVSRLGVRPRADGRGNCSLPTGVRL